ncbi:NPP1 domain-containing protein [Colletotrichum tofieldiae]|uniref:NPP1 domain-containing protein n=1 Tax=Colletotrichum tofieldiae TaxID=708197 RepID=A0A166MLM2_9PEZI|nr:NPP1 domain-containing protein [Colletotrichum tofieldiae]
MLRHSLLSLFTLGLATFASGRALSPRDGDVAIDDKWKDHDALIPFQQQASDGLRGEIELRFKPGLNDGSGCFPYAAVDKDGYHGAGLKPTGKSGEDCRDPSKGQVYSRVGFSNQRTAVLYSWYLPKIQTDSENHKHWYLTVVVWLYTEKCNPNATDYAVAGISYSTGTDTYDKGSSQSTIYSSGDSGTGSVNTHAVVGYDGQVNVFPSADSAQYALSPPLISWDKLPKATADQFNGVRYEHARCPFTDANFQASLDTAYNGDFYINIGAEPDSTTCSANPPTPTPDDTGEPVEDGPDIPVSSMPADPTYTPTPESNGEA